MSRRTIVIFWAAAAAAVFPLGGAVGSGRAVAAGAGWGAGVLLALGALGFAAAVLVAGRITWVSGRAQRRAQGR